MLVKEPSGFCDLPDKAICWSKVIKIVSVISVNMAAPFPNMCPVLTGNTTLCSVVERISLTETCPLWLGGQCPLSGVCLGLAPTIRFSLIPSLEVVGGMPIKEVASVLSPDLGILPIAPLPCLASNKVS